MSDWDIVLSQWPRFADGFATTLILFGLSTVGAFALGIVLVNVLKGRNPAARAMTAAYVDGMRMLPFLIFAYLLYYGLPTFGIKLSAWTAGLSGLILYHGAYVAEILRGSWAQLPSGQSEAAKAQGLYGYRLFFRIVLPQLVLNSAPVLGNQLIYMLKDTAFLMIITVQELTSTASSVQSEYFVPIEPFLVAVALYWLTSLLIEGVIALIHRLAKERGLGRT
jgi:polar amino acid transport system permease protein